MIAGLALSPSLDVTYVVDDLRPGAISVPTRVVRAAGGKTLNASRVAAFLGSNVTVVATLGGHTGAHIAALLDVTGVRLVIVDTGHETRTCVSIASGAAGSLTELYEPSHPLAASTWSECVAGLEDLALKGGDWLILSGSVPAGVPLSELLGLLASARSRGVRIAVDTHGPALDAIVTARAADLVKVNRGEASDLVGAPAGLALVDLAVALNTASGCLAIVTDGVDGSIAVDRSRTVRVEPDPVIGDYAVGSGDSYLGGLVHELHAGRPLDEAVVTAAAAASANSAVPGAALFDAAGLDAARGRVRLGAIEEAR